MVDKTTVSNEEEKNLPADTDQSVEQTAVEPEKEPEKEPQEEIVQLSKADYDKIIAERDNYKTGLLSQKAKSRKLPSVKPFVPKVEPEEEEQEEEPVSDFLTRNEFFKANEQMAIKQVCSGSTEIDGNWDDVVSYYVPRRGKVTVENIAEDLQDAYILWKARNPGVKPQTTTPSEIAKTQLVQEQQPIAGDRIDTKPQAKSIRPPKTTISDWYK